MTEAPEKEALFQENQDLHARLEELEETLRAIRSGDVDALVVSRPEGEQIYTLKGALEPYRVMVENMSEGAVTLAPDGIISYCNGQFAELVKTPLDQVIGQPLHYWVAPHDKDKFGAMLARGWKEVVRDELSMQTSEGKRLPAHLSMCALPESAGKGIAAVITDLTEIAVATEAIRKLNAELEQRIAERTANLETAYKDLEGFAYSVSHDLRTPLRAIDGFSQQVLKRQADHLDDEGKRYLKLVCDNTKKMGQLIDDILAFSRMGRVEMSLSEVNMDRLAREVLEELKPATGRNLVVEIRPLSLARGDRAMLRQVWVNLLTNAIKFTRPVAAACIEVGERTEGAEHIYYVKDNGAGFDMQYAEKLFGVFQRLHGVEEFEGTGIGLAIVKRIVTRHGGRVWAEGRVNKGATIYFTLPVSPGAP